LPTQAGSPEKLPSLSTLSTAEAHGTNDAQPHRTERETVILINDDDEFAEITTHERTRVTKLRKNPAAEQRKDLSFGSTTRAHFRVPAKLVSVRTKRLKLSEEEKAAAPRG
jgi:hypothetical protein